MIRKIFALLALITTLLIAWLWIVPSPVDSVAWRPPKAPRLTGEFAINNALQQSELLGVGEVYGAEDVAVDDLGILYGGTQDGKIIRLFPDGRYEEWVDTEGRPLGLHFDANNRLIVCDAYKGLLAVDQQGDVTTLVDSAEGVPFRFTNDLDIAANGKIYFTDASSRWNQSSYKLDLLESRPYGRLLVHDPATDQTKVLLDQLYFPNGVALSQDESFLLVNETWRYRILRYWLKGERAGESEVFIDNLPGFPDGISSNRNGTFWLALPSPRLNNIDFIYPHPWLKNWIAKLPPSIQPKPKAHGFVLGLNEQGSVIHNLQDPTGLHIREITSVQEHKGYLYFGSLTTDRIGRLKL